MSAAAGACTACASPSTAGTTRFSPDGRLLAIGNRNGRTRVWSTGSWKPVTRTLEGDAGGILAAEISPDGHTLATGNEAGTVRLWDIETEQSVGAPLPGVTGQPVVPIFTADGAGLIAAYATGDAYRWDIRPESLVRHACEVAGRRLTRAEWHEFLPDSRLRPGLLSGAFSPEQASRSPASRARDRTTSIRAAKPLLARLLHRQSMGALTGRAAFPLMASALAIACQRAATASPVGVLLRARSA